LDSSRSTCDHAYPHSRPLFCRRKKQQQGQSGDREEDEEEALLASIEAQKGKGKKGKKLCDRM